MLTGSCEGFPFVLPTTREEQKRLAESLKDWRDRALTQCFRAPLMLQLGREYTTLVEPSCSPLYGRVTRTRQGAGTCFPAPCAHILDLPRPRPRPPCFSVDVKTPRTIRLNERVQHGEGRYSQVYRGTFDDAPDGGSVIVKVYQTSLFSEDDLLCIARRKPYDVDPFDEICQLFKQEYWAYGRLQALQGTVVPHVYGFFEVMLHNGEPTVALVMEDIKAEDPDIYLASSPDARNALASRLLLSLHAVLACGVAPGDLAKRNVLLCKSRVILIDFAPVRGTEQDALPSFVRDMAVILVEFGLDERWCLNWIADHLSNDEWETFFDLDGDWKEVLESEVAQALKNRRGY